MPKLTYEQHKVLAGMSPADGKLMIYKKGKHLRPRPPVDVATP